MMFNIDLIGKGFKGLTVTVGNVSGAIGNATGSFVKGVSDTVGNLGNIAGSAAAAIAKAKTGAAGDVVQKAITGNKGITETVQGTVSGESNPVEELTTNLKGTVDKIPGIQYLPLILAGGAALVAVSILKK